MPTARKPTR
jgi:hypothetical protein